MPMFSRKNQVAPLLLAVFLIGFGVSSFVPIPFGGYILAVLAIAAGVVILLDR